MSWRTSCIDRRASSAMSFAALAVCSSPDIAKASLRSTTDVSEDATEPCKAFTVRSLSRSSSALRRSACRSRLRRNDRRTKPVAHAASKNTPRKVAVSAELGTKIFVEKSVCARYQSSAVTRTPRGDRVRNPTTATTANMPMMMIALRYSGATAENCSRKPYPNPAVTGAKNAATMRNTASSATANRDHSTAMGAPGSASSPRVKRRAASAKPIRQGRAAGERRRARTSS